MHARYAVTFERGNLRHSLRDRASGAGLDIKIDWPGMLVLADARTPLLIGPSAVAIGQLFDAEGCKLDELAAFPLPKGCWGNFACFGADEGGRKVYREPSGSIPVYQVSYSATDVFLSDAELAAALGLLNNTDVDPSFAAHWLQFPYLRSARTGIRQVRELIPGTEVHGSLAGWSEDLSWNPWQHVKRSCEAKEFSQLGEDLRLTVQSSIAAQVSGFRPLLQLSGGLDSSIISACLAASGIDFVAVNFASRSADGDERRHARAIAGRFGAPLKEILEEDLQCAIRAPSERRFRPGSNPVLLPLDEAVEQHRRELGSDLLLDGGGGDNLFCSLAGASPLLDSMRAHGPWAAVRTLGDIAAMSNSSLWAVVAAALRRSSPTGWWRWQEDRRFLTRDALQPCPDPHPWLDAPPLTLPGKREHVASLVHIQHFLDRRMIPGVAALHPLMAQPLIELCLEIPSWEWVRGGIDRAVAREAFGKFVPASIIQRRSKGSLQGMFHRSFARLKAELEDLLLGGRLVSLGIADAKALEQAFAVDSWSDGETQMRLSEMAALELWLGSWQGLPASSARDDPSGHIHRTCRSEGSQ